jgi:F-type H+-transporting ATPase subunit a
MLSVLFAAEEHHHHAPNPIDEVQDTGDPWAPRTGEHVWPFFEDLFGEPVVWHLPVIDFNVIGIPYKFHVTKFMILELIAALLIILIYVPLARKIRDGRLPTGRFWNFFEVLLTFIRDEVARPNLDRPKDEHAHDEHGHAAEHAEAPHGHGPSDAAAPAQVAAAHGEHHEADKYVPFLWTLFLFILTCNLLGMLPMMGSPTASIWVTGGLAFISMVMMHGCVIFKHGIGAYVKALWPTLEMPPGVVFKIMGFMITALLAVIEFVGNFIKTGVLAVRLFANMFAGHLVLANIMFFIYVVGNAFGPGGLWGGVTIASVLGVVALSLLELFVAFLQAYIFTFLTALFMGMALEHAGHH